MLATLIAAHRKRNSSSMENEFHLTLNAECTLRCRAEKEQIFTNVFSGLA